ncbi:MAG: threonine synthase [Planctomycetes bacterium]|nr:threonine synthase [Planctomycetota bacterium]
MFVTHLESAIDGTRFDAGRVLTMHNGRPLWVRYDLAAVKKAVRPADFALRVNSLWRYRELLPLPKDIEPVTLGEGMSPILPCPRLGKELGLSRLFIKDEGQLPTGSFKSRGMAAAVSMAKHLGLTRLAVPTAGNAGGALAAYGARAGMEVFVFMPEDTPVINQLEAFLCGARVFLVNGLINDCGKIVREGIDKLGWFDMSTLKEPYRLEGKKTMGLEIAEQLGWRLPDVIFYPTGGGTGLIGMWKAFAEMTELGWLGSGEPSSVRSRLPKLVSCQSDGCAPIVRAFEKGERFAELFANAHTVASGLRVPAAVGDFMMLDAIRASGGWAIAGQEKSIVPWMRRAASLEGIAICPETAVCFDVLERLVREGRVGRDEEIIVFNTGAAQKYPEAVKLDLPRLDKNRAIDYDAIARRP